MIFVGQAVGIFKMGIRTADLLRPGVHHIHKSRDAAAHMLCRRVSRFISRTDHDAVQHILHAHDISGVHTADDTAARIQAEHRVIGKRHRLVHGGVLQRHQRRHDLRDAGRIQLVVGILLIQDRACGRLHHHCRLCRHHRPLGPAFRLIGHDGQCPPRLHI